MYTLEDARACHSNIPRLVNGRTAVIVRWDGPFRALYGVQFWTPDAIAQGHRFDEDGTRFELIEAL